MPGARHLPPKNMAEYADQELQPGADFSEEEDGEDEDEKDELDEDECERVESDDDLDRLARNPTALQKQMDFEVRHGYYFFLPAIITYIYNEQRPMWSGQAMPSSRVQRTRASFTIIDKVHASGHDAEVRCAISKV